MKLQCKKQNYLNLMKVNLRNNKIMFSNMEVINFVKKLKDFKVLKVLNMDNNPFEKIPSINNKIIRGLPKTLEMYNNQRRVYVQGTIANTADGEGEAGETTIAPDVEDSSQGGG